MSGNHDRRSVRKASLVALSVALLCPMAVALAPFDDLTLEVISVGVSPEGDLPSDAQFTPDGSRIVVACRVSHNLTLLDPTDGSFVQEIPLSGGPVVLDISDDGQLAVTANLIEDTASIVDLTSGVELAAVGVGHTPGLVRITPDASTAVVGNTFDGSLSVIDIASQSEVRRLTGAPFRFSGSVSGISGKWFLVYRDFAITPDSQTVIQPNPTGAEIRFFDIATGSMTAVPCSSEPSAVAISEDGATAVVSHRVSGVTVLDVSSQAITAAYDVETSSPNLQTVVLNPAATLAVVNHIGGVRVVNLSTGAASPVLGNLSNPYDIEITADGGHVITANKHGGAALVDIVGESTLDQYTGLEVQFLAVSPVDTRAALFEAVNWEALAVVDTAGDTLAPIADVSPGPLPEGDTPLFAAITRNGPRVVVANATTDNLSVFDPMTQELLGTASVAAWPFDLAITPDGALAVTVGRDASAATVVDLESLMATDVPVGLNPVEVEISPDGTRAYIATLNQGLHCVDLATLSPISSELTIGQIDSWLPPQLHPRFERLAVSPDGSLIAVSNDLDEDISLIDVATWTETAQVPLPGRPCTLAFSPISPELYVVHEQAGALDPDAVSIIALGPSPGVTDTVELSERFASVLEISPDGSALYVGTSTDVEIIDAIQRQVTDVFDPVNGRVTGLHAESGSEYLLISSMLEYHSMPELQAGTFQVVHLPSLSTVDSVSMDALPAQLAVEEGLGVAVMPLPLTDELALVGFYAFTTPTERWEIYR
jgi:YVTN family beta-propeller protein